MWVRFLPGALFSAEIATASEGRRARNCCAPARARSPISDGRDPLPLPPSPIFVGKWSASNCLRRIACVELLASNCSRSCWSVNGVSRAQAFTPTDFATECVLRRCRACRCDRGCGPLQLFLQLQFRAANGRDPRGMLSGASFLRAPKRCFLFYKELLVRPKFASPHHELCLSLRQPCWSAVRAWSFRWWRRCAGGQE
jgi:hypothetical protein